MSVVGQNGREEMWVLLFPDFERTVTDKSEVCFSKFTFFAYIQVCASLPKHGHL